MIDAAAVTYLAAETVRSPSHNRHLTCAPRVWVEAPFDFAPSRWVTLGGRGRAGEKLGEWRRKCDDLGANDGDVDGP